jgi:hypothetical protein
MQSAFPCLKSTGNPCKRNCCHHNRRATNRGARRGSTQSGRQGRRRRRRKRRLRRAGSGSRGSGREGRRGAQRKSRSAVRSRLGRATLTSIEVRHKNSSSIRTGCSARDLEREMTKTASGAYRMDMCRHAYGAPDHRDVPLAPGDRWRLFASVAACGSPAKRQQAANLYAARLLARRPLTHMYAYGAKVWLPVAASDYARVAHLYFDGLVPTSLRNVRAK